MREIAFALLFLLFRGSLPLEAVAFEFQGAAVFGDGADDMVGQAGDRTGRLHGSVLGVAELLERKGDLARR